MTKVFTLKDLKEIEAREYESLKNNTDGPQHKYCLGRWGAIKELIDELEKETENE